MSALPEGAILTSIDGSRYTAVPHNTSSVDNGVPTTPAKTPSIIPDGNHQAEPPTLPATTPGDVLRETPRSSLSSSIIPNPSSTLAAVEPTSAAPRILPSEEEAPPVSTIPTESAIDGPGATEAPTAEAPEGKETQSPLRSDGPADGTGGSEEPGQSTPTENDAIMPTSTESPGQSTSAGISPTEGTNSEIGGGETGGTDAESSPQETLSQEKTAAQTDGKTAVPTNVDGNADGPDDGLMTATRAGGAITTMGPSTAPSGDLDGEGTPSVVPGTGVVGSANENQGHGSSSPVKAGVIAGSVVGSVAAVFLIVFLIWFWRKRSQRHKYTIQTPVMDPPNTGRTEKTWEFDTGSVGPTPRRARIAEAMGCKFETLGKMLKTSSPSDSAGVSVNRGNSQYAGAVPTRGRSELLVLPNGEQISAKDRLGDWWWRVREDANFNWRLRNEEVTEITPVGSRRTEERRSTYMTPANRRGSDGSAREFQDTLGLMLNDSRTCGNDPFSDAHAVSQNPARQNPFGDSQAILPTSRSPPTAYDPKAQRPRGSTTGSLPRSITPLSRSHVRSDQFDLEIEAHPDLTRPDSARNRPQSYTSRVTSSASSLANWSDPGPDVGRAALHWAEQRQSGVDKAL